MPHWKLLCGGGFKSWVIFFYVFWAVGRKSFFCICPGFSLYLRFAAVPLQSGSPCAVYHLSTINTVILYLKLTSFKKILTFIKTVMVRQNLRIVNRKQKINLHSFYSIHSIIQIISIFRSIIFKNH